MRTWQSSILDLRSSIPLVECALLLIFGAVSIPYFFKAGHASAFVRWHNQIEEIAADEDIYQRHGYPNPPIMALLLWPLTVLPPLIGALAWFYLKALLTLLAVRWSFQLVETAEKPFPLWGQALVALLALRPMLGDLMHGNVNLFILFLVIGALRAVQLGRDGLAGVVLALAIGCKVTPLLFVPYFLWKRAWRTLIGCAAGLLVFLCIVPGSILGMERNGQLLHSWCEQMAEPYLVSAQVLYTEHNNQSLPALVMRLTTASPSFSTYVDGRLAPARFDNLLALKPAQAHWLVRGCGLVFVVLLAWSCRPPTTAPPGWRRPAEYSLVLLGMLLFSERTWKHHCVLLLLPFAVLVYALVDGQRRALVGCALVSSWLLTISTSTGLLDAAWAKQMEVYGGYVWANVILVAALLVLLSKPRGCHPWASPAGPALTADCRCYPDRST